MLKEHPVLILMSITSALISSPVVYQHLIATLDNEPIEEVNLEAPEIHLQCKAGFQTMVSQVL